MPKDRFQSMMDAIRNASPNERGELLNGYFPYETVKFSGRLKILDANRTTAVFTRRQRVRFLEDGVGVLFDRIWGEGILVGSYIAPGLTLMEPIRTPTGYVLPLGLPRHFRKGEIFDVVSHRRIVGAFSQPEGYWDTTMTKPTDLIQIAVVTPPGTAFSKPDIVAPPRGDMNITGKANLLKLRVARPAMNGPYRLRWSWK
jgi:hypothetical protein